ncbi:MAG: hypothetical protein DRP16_00885 [Candidatus Aenigmatarchaeota archaeon]|nr:MAG: hypothetical protein DRP16_00885 [Candidatus Aenigmarchaeota archaeon]
MEQKPSANPLEIAALARQRLRVQNTAFYRSCHFRKKRWSKNMKRLLEIPAGPYNLLSRKKLEQKS